MSKPAERPKILIVGLGYVGLPLGIALARHFDVTGFDVDQQRISELERGVDRTREVAPEELKASRLRITADPANCADADIYIVTVPTPVDDSNRPDLGALLSASHAIGGWINPERRPIVVFESTVYPGVTEEECGPVIAAGGGGLVRGRDFRLGYSPERINPGDRAHRVEAITKVVAGEDEEVVEVLAGLYGAVTGGNIFRAASIKAAEAAKVIENAQRDINIAFMNEVAQIFQGMGLSMSDVLEAARTKWNFLPFEPGLVGGHCIGVDPYYLAHAAQALGHHPQVILAGRDTNDGMGRWITDRLHERRGGRAGSVLLLGLTFKENVPDLRNSRTFDLARRFEELGHKVALADPLADPDEARRDYGVTLVDPANARADLVVGAVAHDDYRALSVQALTAMVAPGGTLADIKGIWRGVALDPAIDRWSL